MRVLATKLMAAAALFLVTGAHAAVRSGDVDGNGDVTNADVESLIGELFDGDGDLTEDADGGDIAGGPGADANDDGLINAGDLSFMPDLLLAPFWKARRPLPRPRQEVGIAELNGLIYVIGGIASGGGFSNFVDAYDPFSDSWEIVTPLPERLHHVPVAVAGGRLYTLGGLGPIGFSASRLVFEYDPEIRTWRRRADMLTARGAGAAATIGSKIYVAGGFRGGSVNEFAVYDTERDMWTALPPMPTARDHLGAAVIDGIFYAAGGRAGRLFDVLEAYDPNTNQWRTLAPMPTARGGLAVTALRGRLFAIGGEGNNADPFGIFPQTEAFDPDTNTWESLPDMLTPRHGIGAAPFHGHIYVPGGAEVEGFGVSQANDALLP